MYYTNNFVLIFCTLHMLHIFYTNMFIVLSVILFGKLFALKIQERWRKSL